MKIIYICSPYHIRQRNHCDANDEVQEIVRYALNTPYAREYIRKLRATSGLY